MTKKENRRFAHRFIYGKLYTLAIERLKTKGKHNKVGHHTITFNWSDIIDTMAEIVHTAERKKIKLNNDCIDDEDWINGKV